MGQTILEPVVTRQTVSGVVLGLFLVACHYNYFLPSLLFPDLSSKTTDSNERI
jgi:hypothetical protein